jgi:hypothetical protein
MSQEGVSAVEDLPIAERRLALEERRVVADENRLRLESRWGWVTRLGVAVPLVILAATLIYNGWEFNRAAEAERERDIVNAQIDGQFRLLDVLVSQDSSQEALDKAQVFDDLEFSQSVGGEPLAQFFDDEALMRDAGSKEVFINLHLSHPEEREALVALWRELYPSDEWVNDLP